MDINGVSCITKMYSGNDLIIITDENDISKFGSFNQDVLKVTKDDGQIEYYGGYYVTYIENDEKRGTYTIHMKKNISELTDKAISAIQNNINVIQSNVESNNYFSKLVMRNISPSINDSEIATLTYYIPDWIPNFSYKLGEILTYDGKYFRVSQDHKSQEQWTPGSVGTESLYYEIVIADDGIIVWSQPSGSYNAPNKGDLRHYPDADSSIYKSLIDGNSYSPTDYPAGWELVE